MWYHVKLNLVIFKYQSFGISWFIAAFPVIVSLDATADIVQPFNSGRVESLGGSPILFVSEIEILAHENRGQLGSLGLWILADRLAWDTCSLCLFVGPFLGFPWLKGGGRRASFGASNDYRIPSENATH